MRRAQLALAGEWWAILPDYLTFMASLAGMSADALAERRESEGIDWHKRDLQAILQPVAGTGMRRLEGARYAMTSDRGVAVIPVYGPIFPRANLMTEMSGATSVAFLANDLSVALKSPDVHAIMLLIDSPGGAVSGINAFADQVFAARSVKPILAHVSGTAASAAYWIASAAGEVASEKTGIMGSIGVVVGVPKQVEPDKDGELTIEVVSTNAPNKRPDPMDEDGVAEIRSMLDAIETQFIADVARGRGVSVAKVRDEFGRGGVKMGKDALAVGMADKVQSYEQSFNHLARIASNRKRAAALT